MRNARIVGMCLGTVASHKKFARDCNLPFDLWLDKGVKVAKKIGIWKEKSLYGRKYFGIERTTFVLDEKGKITKIFPKVKVDGHWKDVLESLSL
jgi:peroxiredoxin Q/BCP